MVTSLSETTLPYYVIIAYVHANSNLLINQSILCSQASCAVRIIFSLDPSPSLPNWLRYGECGEDPAVRQESDDPTNCHRGRRDGRLLNPFRTYLVDKWLQTHAENTGKSSYSFWETGTSP